MTETRHATSRDTQRHYAGPNQKRWHDFSRQTIMALIERLKSPRPQCQALYQWATSQRTKIGEELGYHENIGTLHNPGTSAQWAASQLQHFGKTLDHDKGMGALREVGTGIIEDFYSKKLKIPTIHAAGVVVTVSHRVNASAMATLRQHYSTRANNFLFRSEVKGNSINSEASITCRESTSLATNTNVRSYSGPIITLLVDEILKPILEKHPKFTAMCKSKTPLEMLMAIPLNFSIWTMPADLQNDIRTTVANMNTGPRTAYARGLLSDLQLSMPFNSSLNEPYRTDIYPRMMALLKAQHGICNIREMRFNTNDKKKTPLGTVRFLDIGGKLIFTRITCTPLIGTPNKLSPENHLKQMWSMAENRFSGVMHVKPGNKKMFMDRAASFMWHMAHFHPAALEGVNPDIIEWILIALATEKAIVLGTWNEKDRFWNNRALTSTEADFKEWFHNEALEQTPDVVAPEHGGGATYNLAKQPAPTTTTGMFSPAKEALEQAHDVVVPANGWKFGFAVCVGLSLAAVTLGVLALPAVGVLAGAATIYALIASCGSVGFFGSWGCGWKAFGGTSKRASSENFAQAAQQPGPIQQNQNNGYEGVPSAFSGMDSAL
jgi:hypothetical protein